MLWSTKKLTEICGKIKAEKDFQFKIIEELFDYFRKNKKWPEVKTFKIILFNKKINENELEKCLKHFPYLIKKGWLQEGEGYYLTECGFWYCMDEKDKELLIKYLKLVKRKVNEESRKGKEIEKIEISSAEIKGKLNLSPEQLDWLGHLIRNLNLYSGAVWSKSGEWKVGLPREIEKLMIIEDLKEFIENCMERLFHQEVQRMRREKTEKIMKVIRNIWQVLEKVLEKEGKLFLW